MKYTRHKKKLYYYTYRKKKKTAKMGVKSIKKEDE